jgi:hypothetical protein
MRPELHSDAAAERPATRTRRDSAWTRRDSALTLSQTRVIIPSLF